MRLLSLLAIATLSLSVHADVLVENAFARATPPDAINSAAFMTIHNDGKEAIKLVSASSSASDVVELHNHEMHMGMMRMRQVEAIEIAGHGSTELKPGGLHVMLFGLKEPLREGTHIKVDLRFSNGDTQFLSIPVKNLMAEHGMNHSGGMKHHADGMKMDSKDGQFRIGW
jgi:copper(I)-binding protein